MPTLIQINVTANWGSTGKIAEAIGRSVMKKGWKSYIAYGRMMNPSESQLIKVGEKMDSYIHFAYNRLLDMEGRGSVRATKTLVRQIVEIKPDVVQLHNIHDHFLNYRILFEYLNQTDIQVVWTFHDCWAFTGHCYHFVQQDCMKWKKECGKCVQRNRFVDRSRENFLLKKGLFDGCKNLTIVPCSEWMGNFVKESFLKEKHVEVIHNGVDLTVFKHSVTAVKKSKVGKFRIIAVSNVWLPYKGELDIYKLSEMLPLDEFEITMVGLSIDQVKNLPVGICGIQRTQNVQELVQLYSESDVLINPTYADTFPTVNLEALACGTPVITYRTGGSPEAIDEKTGVVVEQGNVESLANAIHQMKEYPLSSEDCRKRAEECFDKDKCFEKYIELYNDLLQKN
ncbi:glycosyltransferase [Bacteroides salyersiae]|uniref:glycosyltransferase n=1 Tax=Bacteroides salyersiae TaxID=291644 RepID=UPI000326EF54|nr:glycosyltransferase [Bacteroides salyersiae]EOA51798.1 hypothetical protein HMPREF1532_00003 [Bacteroides salyersiae WAL 10018 = DSM 18765 = JCM 12988]MBT9874155.1 glycosyltransferase [Bacteroides salyersiae]